MYFLGMVLSVERLRNQKAGENRDGVQCLQRPKLSSLEMYWSAE